MTVFPDFFSRRLGCQALLLTSWLSGPSEPAHPSKVHVHFKVKLQVCLRVFVSHGTHAVESRRVYSSASIPASEYFSLSEWLTVVLQPHNRRLLSCRLACVCVCVLTLDASIKVRTLECMLCARHSRSGSLPSPVSAGVADLPCVPQPSHDWVSQSHGTM